LNKVQFEGLGDGDEGSNFLGCDVSKDYDASIFRANQSTGFGYENFNWPGFGASTDNTSSRSVYTPLDGPHAVFF
jgi:hypothetical protein